MNGKKPKRATFKLAVKTPDGFRGHASGECDEGLAFALYALPLGSAEGNQQQQEGTAGEFRAARAAYLSAAAKYHAEIDSKRGAS